MMTAQPVGPYSPIVRVGDWLITSGQIGAVDGRIVDGGLAAELVQVFANLASVLGSEGATLADVVKTTVYLRHIEDYATMNELYVEAFAGHRPARTACAVAGLPLGALVEIEAWVHHPGG